MIKGIRIIILCLIVFSSFKVVLAASDILLIEADPQISGMAHAGVGLSENACAYNMNPAGIGLKKKYEAGAGFFQWFGGINVYNISGVLPVGPDASLGVNFIYRSLSFKQTDEWGLEKSNEIGIKTYIENINLGTRIIDNLYAGLGIKFIQDYMRDFGALFQVLDYGLFYQWRFLSTGFSALNSDLGKKVVYDNREEVINSTKKIGVGANFFEKRLNFAFDLIWGDELETRFNTGGQYHIGQLLIVRAGYQSYYGAKFDFIDGITAGFGLRWRNIGLDYSWFKGSDLNDENSFIGIKGISKIGLRYVF